MSEKPLFQNADEEEAIYGGTQTIDPEVADTPVIIPGAAAANGAIAGQLGVGAAGMGAAPASGAVIAGANRSADEDLDQDGVIEDDEHR